MASSEKSTAQVFASTSAFLCDLWGADKVLRFLAYAAKIAASRMELREGTSARVDGIRKLGGAVSDARTVMRFFGTIDAIAALLTNNQTDPVLRRISDLQAASMVVYHPLEHFCWAAWCAPKWITTKAERVNDLSRYSCIAWLAYILLEFASQHRRLKLLQRALERSRKDGTLTEEERVKIQQQQRRIHLEALVSAANLPLAVHWSVKRPFLGEATVGVLGVVGAIVGGYLKATG